MRAASEPTEREPTVPEPDTRPTSYANKYNWTANARAPLGETTARNRLAALKAAAETDERIIRVRWSDPRTIAGLCVFIPLLFFDEFLAISRGFILRVNKYRARGLVFGSRHRINTQLYVPRAMDDPSSV